MIEYVNRSGSNCYKWDSECARGKLPLWVADMDFKVAPAIIEALEQRVQHGVFGYNIVSDEYFEAVGRWFERRHSWSGITKANSVPTIGVVPAISAVLRAMTSKGDGVVTFLPAYNCFFSSIKNLDCELKSSELRCVDNHYEIDWDDFSEKAKQAKIFLLCNPHNPTGRIWRKEELEKLADICHENNLFVISDEIHCEFEFPNYRYTPFCLVAKDDNYCVCTSASKAFNIAGLQCANIFVPNKNNYNSIEKAINIHEVCDLNPLGVVATIAAYNKSENWINELNEYVYGNYCFLRDFLTINMPLLRLTRAEGTYLAWINIKGLGLNSEELCRQLSIKQNVLFNPSQMYGCEDYIRINLATSRSIIEKAMSGFMRLYHEISTKPSED